MDSKIPGMPTIKAVHGKNPMNLIEKILQTRIFRNNYWKERCFALTAETLTERAIELEYIGGTFGGNKKPTPFICLILAMLQLQPEKEIVIEFILNDEYKYVRALGAFYLRLVGTAIDIYQYLEPFLMDYRKLKVKTDMGFKWTYMDEFIDNLLVGNYSCDISLPFLTKRWVLEENGQLEPRKSGLADVDLTLEPVPAMEKDDNEIENEIADAKVEEIEKKYDERMKREKGKWKKKTEETSPSKDKKRSTSRSRSPRHSRKDRSSSRDRRDRRRDSSRERRDRRSSSRDRRKDRSSSRERYYRRDRSSSRDRYRRDRDGGRDRRDYDRERRRDRSSSRDRYRDRRRDRSSSRERYKRDRSYSRDRKRDNSPRRKRDEPPPKDRNERAPPTRPGNKRKRSPEKKDEAPAKKSSKGEITMSVNETNELRKKLGLPLLK